LRETSVHVTPFAPSVSDTACGAHFWVWKFRCLPGARLHSWGLVVSTEAEREAAYFKLCDDVRLDLEIRREIAYQKKEAQSATTPNTVLSVIEVG
jgi:hypothetical protein